MPSGWDILLDRLEATLGGSEAIYPFGAEKFDPEQEQVKQAYEENLLKMFPGLLRWKPITVERTFNASPERIWNALTDKDQMKQWYFTLSDFKPEVGFEFSFPGQGRKGENYIHRCKITEVIPLKKLAYTWTYENYEGHSLLSFELFAEGDKTRLKLVHTGLGSFPKDNADFARESFAGGWDSLINQSLKKFLEG